MYIYIYIYVCMARERRIAFARAARRWSGALPGPETGERLLTEARVVRDVGENRRIPYIYIYMYVCICMYVCIYIYIYTHV